MKTLIWKEWRELRMIPLGMTFFFVMANIICAFLEFLARRAGNLDSAIFTTVGIIMTIGAICCIVSGALCGSALFSGEIGAGTLTFLTMLPIRRETIWLSKVIAGLASVFITVSGVLLVGAISLFIRYAAAPAKSQTLFEPVYRSHDFWAGLGVMLLAAIGCFSVALTISLLVDRTLVSAILAIVACLALPTVIVAAISAIPLSGAYAQGLSAALPYTLLVLVIPSFFAASRYIFVNGETLRSPKRFVLLGQALAAWALVNVLVIVGIRLA